MLTLLRAVDDATEAYPKLISALSKNCMPTRHSFRHLLLRGQMALWQQKQQLVC